MSIFEEAKIDSHCHLLDPLHFPYASDAAYLPQGQEIGGKECFKSVMDCYAVKHALLVGPNSGYNLDNRCMLDAIASSQGRFKGIAVVEHHASRDHLAMLKQAGVVGIAFNPSLKGIAAFHDLSPLLTSLEALGMWAQFQVEGDQLIELWPMIEAAKVRVLVDHCGRPVPSMGLHQAGFQKLLAIGRQGQAAVKLSGYAKFSKEAYPFNDARPYIEALAHAFGLDQCLWASDWPYLKAPYRLDYGPMLKLFEDWFSASERRQIFWDTPMRLFDFVG